MRKKLTQADKDERLYGRTLVSTEPVMKGEKPYVWLESENTRTQITDVRQDKRYGRSVTWSLGIEIPDTHEYARRGEGRERKEFCEDWSDEHIHALNDFERKFPGYKAKEIVKEEVEAWVLPDGWKITTEGDFGWGNKSVYVKVYAPAEKPSKILDERTIIDEVLSSNITHVPDMLSKAVAQGVQAWLDEQAHEQRVRQANVLTSHLVDKAKEKAAKIVRLEQRMAALQAEYQAEVKEQTDAMIAELEAKPEDERTYSNDNPIDPRVYEAAVRGLDKWGENFKAHVGTGMGFPRSRSEHYVEPEEVD